MTPSEKDEIVHRHTVVLLLMVLHNLVEFWTYLLCSFVVTTHTIEPKSIKNTYS